MYNSFHNKHRLIFSILAVIVLAISAITTHFTTDETERSSTPGNLTATFIDVDQGDSCLLETPNGETILIDGGEYDTYETHLEPFLDSREIYSVDTAIVTHYHSDHLGGISELVKKGRVENLVLPDYDDTDSTRSDLEESARDNGTKISYASAGDSLNTNCPELNMDVLHPQKGGFEGKNFHNNSSMVLRITYGKTTFLITGDIEARAEKSILKLDDIECDILKIAHHGSSTSSTKDFVRAANPTYGIISAGLENSYGHPHHETLDLMQDEDIRIYRTDQDGDITFTVSPEKIENISFSK